MTYIHRLAVGLALSAIALGIGAAQAQAPTRLSIVIFSSPSLGAFMPPVIKAKKFDEANGLDISFQERTPDAYTAQFNSGEFKIGGSASLMTIGLAGIRGVKVRYLFNLFDFWGAVVTSRPDVKTLKDLEGKDLAAARSTTNYVMFEFFAKKMGADVSKIQVVNTAPPGLVGYAIADRAAAVQLWEPAYTLLKTKKPSIQLLDTNVDKTWKDFAGDNRIHAVLGTSEHCIATHPSDLCVALAAADATVRVADRVGERTIPFADFHLAPGLRRLLRLRDLRPVLARLSSPPPQDR